MAQEPSSSLRDRHFAARGGSDHPGQTAGIELALATLLARGHLLIEDIPGVGKTTLAHLFARLLGLHFQRIQFTSDLLPADVLGVSIFDRGSGGFRFHPGPIFAQLILADEINRATPKTQSALLEVLEEEQVTADGETHPLPSPFFVITRRIWPLRSAPSRCPKANSIDSCCGSRSATPTRPRNGPSARRRSPQHA